MIVKIKNTDGSYSYFEGDSIMQSRSRMKLSEMHNICNPDTLFITTNDNDGPMDFLHLNLYKKHKSTQWIVTNHRCYVMNDEGKTIDKIN